MDKGPSAPTQTVIVPPTSNLQPPTPLVLGPDPARVTCPSCHAEITTTVDIESSTMTHLMALLLCLIFPPCVCIPYCTESCQSKNHYCPNCRAYLGRYNN